MLKRTITYSDVEGQEITENFFFNLNEAEITELNFSTAGTFASYLEDIQRTQNVQAATRVIKDIIGMSYGKKSDDGRRFIKSPELSEEFFQTDAYNRLFMEFIENPEHFGDFLLAIVPAKLANQVSAEMAAKGEFKAITSRQSVAPQN